MPRIELNNDAVLALARQIVNPPARKRDPIAVAIKYKERRRAYRQANKGLIAAHASKRKALRLQATPAWVDLEAIMEIYREAARLTAHTGVKHHVDHVLPLRSRTICGLHVPWNLRIITAVENLRKGNRFDTSPACGL